MFFNFFKFNIYFIISLYIRDNVSKSEVSLCETDLDIGSFPLSLSLYEMRAIYT